MAAENENKQGRVLLEDKDFVDVVDVDGNVVGSVPKHWGPNELDPGLKKAGK